MVMSVYLWHTEGSSLRNRDIIAKVLQLGRLHGGPWIAGGDFNMDPESLREFPGLDAGEVTVIAPPRSPGTCVSRHGPVVLDYFLVSRNLAPDIQSIKVLLDGKISPHRPVLTLRTTGRSRLVNRLDKPTDYPMTRVTGPAPPPATWAPPSGDLHEEWRAFSCSAEHDISALCGLDGQQASKAAGRDKGPVFRMQSAIGPKAAKFGACVRQATLLVAARRLQEALKTVTLIRV